MKKTIFICKRLARMLVLMLPLLGLLYAYTPVYAQSTDELSVVITSDKEEYKKGEIAETTITVTNQSDKAISNVAVKCLLPDGLSLVEKDSDATSVDVLEAGKALTMKVHVKTTSGVTLTNPQTGDNTMFWVFPLLFIVSAIIGVVCFWLKKEKGFSLRKIGSILAFVIFLTGIFLVSPKLLAQNSVENKSIQESKEIIFEKNKYDISFKVTYTKQLDTPSEGEDLENTDSAALELVDFLVEVENGREPVILHISDTQIVDPTQRGQAGIPADQIIYYALERMDENLWDSLEETVTTTKPDLILLTGDLVYGIFDNNGSQFLGLIEKMESYGIPWAPVFGNHDNESAKGVDWQCQQLENAKHCLFKQRTLTGNGNYTVGIKQGGMLKRVFFMMDSNGCSSQGLANAHTNGGLVGFANDQINWSINLAGDIKKLSPKTKISFAFHIQIYAFKDAYTKYGFPATLPLNIDKLSDKAESDFGYLGTGLKSPWDADYYFYNQMKSVGVDSIFVGHEHRNSASVVHDGIRFQYGQKMGTYDRSNYVADDGTIHGGYVSSDTPISGGTVLKMSEKDGSFIDAYIYLSGDAQEKLNGTYVKPDEEEKFTVNGLQVGKNLSPESTVSISEDTIGGHNAWKCTANSQGKVLVSPDLLKNKTRFTFSVYLPPESQTALSGLNELPSFAIRVKPNNSEPALDNYVNGYIEYCIDVDDVNRKLFYGQWQTFSVDITGLGETCTQFAFIIPKKNVIYLKDIAFE